MPLDNFLPKQQGNLPFAVSPDKTRMLITNESGVIFKLVGGIGNGRDITPRKAIKIRFASNDVAVILDDSRNLLVLDVVSLTPAIPNPPVQLTGVEDFEAGQGKIGVTFTNGTSLSMTERGKNDVFFERAALWSTNSADLIGFEAPDGIDIKPTESDDMVPVDVYGAEVICSSIDKGTISITSMVDLSHTSEIVMTTVSPSGHQTRRKLSEIPRAMQEPTPTVDRASAELLLMSGYINHEPRSEIIARDRSAAKAMHPKILSGRTRRTDIDLQDKGTALVSIESSMSPPRRFVLLSRKTAVEEYDIDTGPGDVFLEPVIDYEGEVVLADSQEARVTIYKFDSLPANKRTTVVMMGTDSVQAGRYSPTMSWLLTHGFAVMLIDLPGRYNGPVNGLHSSSAAQDGGHDINDVVLSLKRKGILGKTFVMGHGVEADAAIVASSIVKNSIDGVIAVSPALKSFELSSGPVGCDLLIISDNKDKNDSTMSAAKSFADNYSRKRRNIFAKGKAGAISILSVKADNHLRTVRDFLTYGKL